MRRRGTAGSAFAPGPRITARQVWPASTWLSLTRVPAFQQIIRQKIFTPFFTTKRDVGTGLGLWIVRDLLLRRGGSILCRSRAEGSRTGTVMMVFLPTEQDEPASDRTAELA